MIREATAADARAIAGIYGPLVARTTVTFETEPPDAIEMAGRIEAGRRHTPWLVWEDAGQVVAYAYASRHHVRPAYQWSVDVSLYVDEGRRRQGLGRALYSALFTSLRERGFYAAHASITMDNIGSIRLHEAMGFVPIAVFPRVGFKHGAWHDVGWWQLELRPRTGVPAPPRLPAGA